MNLEIIYYICQNKEISLFELCKKLYGSINRINFSAELKLANSISDLYANGFINIFEKSYNGVCSNIKAGSNERDNDINKIIRSAISEITSSCEYESVYGIEKKKTFLSVTDKYEKTRQVLDFSVTYEMNKMKEDIQRQEIFGRIKSTLNSQIFVIMPFKDAFKPVYEDHIKKICDELEYSCQRADLIDSANVIINDIWSLINNAEIIVCDCTGRNPNVFYELGLAHAIGKEVICITQNEKDIPFDIKQIRYIKYDYTPRGMEEFEKTLKRFMITNNISE